MFRFVRPCSGDVERRAVRPNAPAADVARGTARQEERAGGHDAEGARSEAELAQPGHAERPHLLLQQVRSVWVRNISSDFLPRFILQGCYLSAISRNLEILGNLVKVGER